MTLSNLEQRMYKKRLLRLNKPTPVHSLENKTINQNIHEAIPFLPSSFVDLLFIDPPYNLTKSFNSNYFKEMAPQEYGLWFEPWFERILPALKTTASVYVCSDWRSSGILQQVLQKFLTVRNRITWERDKGRGARSNWKNNTEDLWFCTVSDDYTFNIDAVKIRKKVIAPYTDDDGEPKDWQKTGSGNFRLTHPSNIWTDLTIPFWSMPENTDHPAQKPEKLLAKIILASSNSGDFVLDPFAGSGTTSVVAKKLGRRYLGIELDEFYACLAEKRLARAEADKSIQGYAEDVFWERNSLHEQKSISASGKLSKNGKASGGQNLRRAK
ncbi:MAG TPA: site-specific DNA-methyltransferase [Bacteroidota bacterium]|nr:site-specific DNA-methyltransferase [Bacteroidota bacterium]